MTNVLIVEDNYYNMVLVSELLRLCGCTFDSAFDGEEAISNCEQTNYDMILMDIELPGANGIEVNNIIRTKPGYQDIPIIAVTAYGMPDDMERFLSLGFDAYLSKPIDFDIFFEMIKKYRK